MNIAPQTYLVSDIKSFLKQLATVIRIKKIMRKADHNQHLEGFSQEQLDLAEKVYSNSGLVSWQLARNLDSIRDMYRAHHIAYCEFRGKSRTQIENKTSDGEPYPNDVIERIKSRMLGAHKLRAELLGDGNG